MYLQDQAYPYLIANWSEKKKLWFRYNLMIDYDQGIEYGISSLVVNSTDSYILSYSTSNGYIFTWFPVLMDQIDVNKVKENTYPLEDSKLTIIKLQLFWYLFNYSNNQDETYNEYIEIICQMMRN